jgi:Rod binding domain-containing protein
MESDRSPFAARLAAMQSQHAETSPAREAVNKLVASAFIIPALESLRENSLAAEEGPFAPNVAQKRFGPILDQHIADEIVSATDFRLTDTILERYSKMPGGQHQQMNGSEVTSHDRRPSHVNTKA